MHLSAENQDFSVGQRINWRFHLFLQSRAHPVKNWRSTACATPLRLNLHTSYPGACLCCLHNLGRYNFPGESAIRFYPPGNNRCPISWNLYSLSASSSQRAAQASLGIRKSPRGDRVTEPTFGPSGRQDRLNCWEKNRR